MPSDERSMTFEYLILSLPTFGEPSVAQGDSASVTMLNVLGQQGWEAVGMTQLTEGTVAVLLKRSTGNADSP